MRLTTQILLLLLLMCLRAGAQSRFVTLQVDARSGLPSTNILVITANETAEVVYISEFADARLHVYRNGSRYEFVPQNAKPLIVTGPAELRYEAYPTTFGLCTIKVSPESFAPDKTIIIPEGTAGANITLECSTNLINWATTTNGVYTGTNGAKFFRIRADRIP